MTEYIFDPTDYQFVPDPFHTEISVWTTQRDYTKSVPTVSGGVIGSYVMTYYSGSWTVEEICLKNTKEFFVTLYRGRIPDQKFGDELMRNLELEIPIIQRENLINKIME